MLKRFAAAGGLLIERGGEKRSNKRRRQTGRRKRKTGSRGPSISVNSCALPSTSAAKAAKYHYCMHLLCKAAWAIFVALYIPTH